MKKMLYVLLISLLSFTIFSCAKKSDTSSTTTTTTELEGTWVSSCTSTGSKYVIKTFTVSGTNVTDKSEYHSDSSCATDDYSFDWSYSSLSIGEVATFSGYGTSGGSGHQTTMTLDTITYTSLSASDVTWNNANSYCGETDWVINIPQSIAGKTCQSETQWSLNITIYGLYILDGSTLIPNFAKDSHPSGVATDTIVYIKQ